MAKGIMNNPLLKKLLAIGVKEHIKTATEAEVGEVLKLSVAMDSGESEGADAEHGKGCDCKDCMGTGKDAKANDARARLHKALDKMLDSKEASEQEEQEALDADMEQLRGLLAGGAGAEKTKDTPGVDSEEEHAEKLEELAEEERAEGEDSEEEDEAEDEAVQSEASPVLPEGARAKSPAPSAVDAATVLKALKPFIANAGTVAGQKRLAKAFDTASKLTKPSKGSKASYSAVQRAAAATGKDAAAQLDRRDPMQKAADEANAVYREMRGKNSTKK